MTAACMAGDCYINFVIVCGSDVCVNWSLWHCCHVSWRDRDGC